MTVDLAAKLAASLRCGDDATATLDTGRPLLCTKRRFHADEQHCSPTPWGSIAVWTYEGTTRVLSTQ